MILEKRKACNWYGVHVGSLSNIDSDGNDEHVNKSKTTILHVKHTFCYILFPWFLGSTSPAWNFLMRRLCRTLRHSDYFFLSFLKLSAVPKNLTRRKFTCIWHNYHFFAEKVPLSCYIRYSFLWQIVSLSHAGMNNSQNQDVFTTFSQP